MKKVKLNVDKEAIRQFFVQHAEKVVLGVAGVCFVLIVFKAFARPPFDQTPEKLADSAENARRHIESTAPTSNEGPGPVDVSLQDVEEDLYKHQAKWDPEIIRQGGPRRKPEYLAVIGLRGIAGMGAFALNSAGPAGPGAARRTQRGSGKSAEGQRWIVVTGKVPYKGQVEQYEACFAKAERSDAEKDVPNYYSYRVERAEVTGQTATANPLNWTPLSLSKLLQFKQRWAREGPEVVDVRYLIIGISFVDSLAVPLGPLVPTDQFGQAIRVAQKKQSPWNNDSVAYPPDIPLKSQEQVNAAPVDVRTPAIEEPGDPFGSAGPTRKVNDAPTPVRMANPNQPPEFKLFRFFDFTVQPGKAYVYRVQLRLQNPNLGFEDRYLDKTVLDERNKWRDLYIQKKAAGDKDGATAAGREWSTPSTPWSDPTSAVSVPHDSHLFAVSVTPPSPNRPTTQPKCKMLVVKWVKGHGKNAFESFEAERGKVLNFPGMDFPPKGQPGFREPDAITVDYITETLVLDMRASYFSSREAGPGEILLMDGNGNLVLRNELDDRPQYDKYYAAPTGPDGRASPDKRPGRLDAIDLE